MNEEIKKYINELKTIKMIKDGNPRFLSIETYKCFLNNGSIITREKIIKNNSDGSAAIILPITIDNKVILAIETRVFTNDTVDIGLPAGYIEKGEEPIVAAKRELLEETGYRSDKLVFLGSYYQDQGCSAAYNYYYLAFDCKKVKDQNLDDGEYIKYIVVDIDELDEIIRNNMIKGLNSIYAINEGMKLIRKKENL